MPLPQWGEEQITNFSVCDMAEPFIVENVPTLVCLPAETAAFRIRWRNQTSTGVSIPAFAGMTIRKLENHLDWDAIA